MNLFTLPTGVLLSLFIASTILIWIIGIRLTKAVDLITTHFELGGAFGGLVFLSIVTNLPEIAITAVAAYNKDYDIAISNLLGGIAIQTVVLVFIDIWGVGRTAPLTLKGHSKILIIEGVSLIFILSLIIIGNQFSPNLIYFRSTPFEWIILFIWLGTIGLVASMHKKRKKLGIAETNSPLRMPKSQFKGTVQQAIWVLVIGAIITLVAGWALTLTGEQLATRWNMSGILFGATILALCTALPEISTGIASAKLRDYNMAVSDIFGGNAFLPVLFLMASFISGDAILPNLKPSDIYLTVLGIILTGIYMVGMIIHSNRQFLRMGMDSVAVLITYLLGLWGLLALT